MQEALVDDFQKWRAETEAAKPAIDTMVKKLEQRGATVESFDLGEVGALSYHVQFPFPDGAQTNMLLRLKDYQSRSDLVITNMTTLPDTTKSKGHGSEAVRRVLVWAKESGLKTVRAVQVSVPEAQNFWRKNGFKEAKDSYMEDFLLTIKD